MPSVLDLINKPLVTAIGVPVVLGMSVGSLTRHSVRTWYPALNKPSWTPPNWVFPVAWTSLYASMGYASYLIYRAGEINPLIDTSSALKLYAGQLALNLAWTPLFFGVHRLGAATVDIVALLGSVVATAVEFGKIDGTAGWLMAPYAAWVAYATSLTIYIWRNNGKRGPAGRKAL
ncbi:hypothetical protein PhCBS80983_g06119 [Powellomyces hirtus]|uniref:TspO/MBR-related protein n=1 Tax=Powellomyces hirtus TaxID=109895 RepID=A0A507DQB5_9FUNG|nr:hypothetical protein PhCBS80983_g06119 [Powellomyces hirtus]